MNARRALAPKPVPEDRPEDMALDALARALAPRVAELLRRSATEDALSEVLAGTEFEIDRSGL